MRLNFSQTPNPNIVMASVDCNEYVQYLMAKDFEMVGIHLLKGVRQLKDAGCNLLVIASNTGHLAVPVIERTYPELKLLHIADCCAYSIRAKGYSQVGLIGTKPTMEQSYLKDRLALHGITTVVPQSEGVQDEIFRIIVDELSYNNFVDSSREFIVTAIRDLKDAGCEACILGCTEIELLVSPEHVQDVHLLPSAEIHIDMAVNVLLGKISLHDILPPPPPNATTTVLSSRLPPPHS
jgi:aspartate racemase